MFFLIFGIVSILFGLILALCGFIFDVRLLIDERKRNKTISILIIVGILYILLGLKQLNIL